VAVPGLIEEERRRRGRHMRLWRLVNPLARPLAGIAPWWVLLETTGRRSGRPIRTPLARGPVDGGETTWLIAVHGAATTWVKNLEAAPRVRIRIGGRWRQARARLMPSYDPSIVARFNAYARTGPRTLGIDPALVRIDLERS
jgi:deazaflavin-dependent oxidoreductase (nitroreductase family)